jgi:hypothetical protein
MTGSWTLPEARGRGCFATVIEESVALTRLQGGVALLAFVTEDNASYRRLVAAGASLVPTTYAFSKAETPKVAAAGAEGVSTPDPVTLEAACAAMAGSDARVEYTPETWASQLLHRDGPTRVLQLGPHGHAVMEAKGDFDRMQAWTVRSSGRGAALAMVLADAQARGRKFFTFTLDTDVAEACRSLGLGTAPGFMTVLPTGASELGKPYFQSGDRM